jgi:enamine deaminase RidA (YjgF/YER057c/UK114 family)
MRQEIQPAQFPRPETYATGYKIGDNVWLAGQTPVGDDGKVVGVGDPRAQARRIFERIGLCLKEAGATPQDVIFFRTYLTDLRNAPVVREERAAFFGGHRPSSTLLQVVALAQPEFLMEFEVVAVVGSGGAR